MTDPIEARPAACEGEIEIDLTASRPLIRFGGRRLRGEISEGTRRSLVERQWDARGQLLDGRDATEVSERDARRLGSQLAGCSSIESTRLG